MKTQIKKAIVLLSGGLDSVVSLALAKNEGTEIKLALTFNYGQKSFEKELDSAKKISHFYDIEHKVITLDWLKEITNTSLVSDKAVPETDTDKLDDNKLSFESMKNVWVPNRNGLFINIAASFADSYGYDYIIIGANREEASTFSDNSLQFINDTNKVLETSANYNVKAAAPLIGMNKTEIVKKATELEVPLEMINSCYNNTEKHCAKCESCTRLKRALISAGRTDLTKKLFEKEGI